MRLCRFRYFKISEKLKSYIFSPQQEVGPHGRDTEAHPKHHPGVGNSGDQHVAELIENRF